ncbi:organomercurial lyase [Halocatena pleomorpha]|uniref:Alkylmercury lyase n=1 Tax=Halocatena pleomorpha TaxID=1785090 RepID=A0A3P3RKL8_9EURY|nr:organomercurial lyase [Halocatena pleomorpha]RRJ34087.1 alkylmercury lyase [Halocatena pleomorpha]
MSDRACDCCESASEQANKRTDSHDRWLSERPVTNARLPPDMARRMKQLLDAESLETLGDFVRKLRDAASGTITIDDLCHASTETPHRATVGSETYHFLCFYDGVALTYLVDKPVTIQTESPAGKRIEMRATPDGSIEITPADAVMSFGVAADVEIPGPAGPIEEVVYKAVCPYVKAFPSRETYESWAAGVGAATVGMVLPDGVPIAAALVD